MNGNEDEQRPKIRLRGQLYTLADRSAAELSVHDEHWIVEARKVHRQIQEEGPTPELLDEFRDVAADYAKKHLASPDGSLFPKAVARDLTFAEFSALMAAVQYVSKACWPGPTALVRKSRGVLEVQ